MRTITIARKPFEGTFAENVTRHGVGGLNVDACRIGTFVSTTPSGFDRYNERLAEQGYRPGTYQKGTPPLPTVEGRWPANVVLAGDDVVDAIGEESGVLTSGQIRPGYTRNAPSKTYGQVGADHSQLTGYGDTGTAARFFKVIDRSSE